MPPPDARAKATGIGCLALLIVVGGIGAWGWHADQATQEAVFDPAHVIHISAEDIASDWNANEVAASKRYTGASIIVTGEVGKISGAGDSHPSVYLGGNDIEADADLILRSDADAVPLRPGQTATFDCVGSRQSLGSVVLDACRLEPGSNKEAEI